MSSTSAVAYSSDETDEEILARRERERAAEIEYAHKHYGALRRAGWSFGEDTEGAVTVEEALAELDAELAADQQRRRDSGEGVPLAPGSTYDPVSRMWKVPGDSWMSKLQTRADGKGLLGEAFNAYLILKNASEVRGTVRWNDYNRRIEIHGGELAPASKLGFDSILTAAQNWLAERWGLSVGYGDVAHQLGYIAMQHKYNPLHDYLLNLKWAGESRIDTFFIRYLGAPDTPHMRRISRRFLLGAVARALPSETWATPDGMELGVKFDNVVILESVQGQKKTAVWEALAGKFYCTSSVTVGDKDSKMLTASNWFIDSSELSSFKRAETESVKEFLTTRTDTFRPPYGRDTIQVPRHCVLVGATNEDEYLTDTTGNRRFWCVAAQAIDLPAIMRDRDQLWAEAVAVYLGERTCKACHNSTDTVSGQRPRCAQHRWWLDRAEEADARLETDERLEELPLAASVWAWWTSMAPAKRPRSVTTADVAAGLRLTADRLATTRGLQTQIGRVMKELGFEKHHLREGQRQVWVYAPSEELLTAQQSEKALQFPPR